MIIGILGFRGSGKNAVADILKRESGAQSIGFADPLKRMTMKLFDFKEEQVWGTQEQKEAPDLRYPRLHSLICTSFDEQGYCQCCGTRDVETQCYLTGRYALQTLGTEGARACWDDIWVKLALDEAKLIEHGRYTYYRTQGPVFGQLASSTAVFTDCRFENEVTAILKAGGKVYRIKRKGYEAPVYDHPSETEQLRIPDDRLSGVIMNTGSLEDLKDQVLSAVGYLP